MTMPMLKKSSDDVFRSTPNDLLARSNQPLVSIVDDHKKTVGVKKGDLFYVDSPSTPNVLVMHGKQDSPRIQNLKELLQLLVEKISISDPKIDMEILKESLEEFILLLKEIFKDGKKVELNALRISLWSMSSSGRSRILEAISVRDDANEEIQKNIKKIIIEEVPRR